MCRTAERGEGREVRQGRGDESRRAGLFGMECGGQKDAKEGLKMWDREEPDEWLALAGFGKPKEV